MASRVYHGSRRARSFWPDRLLILLIVFALLAFFSPAASARKCSERVANFSSAKAITEDPELINLHRFIVQPVLDEGGRAHLADIEFNSRQKSITITSAMGKHVVRLTDVPEKAYPQKGLPDFSTKNGRVNSDITLHGPQAYSDLIRSQGVFRSALRADRFLYPQLKLSEADARYSLSFPQRESLAALIAMESKVQGRRGLKRGLVAPVGMGKTLIAAKYVAALGAYNRKLNIEGWKKKPKILFVVENRWILDRTVETFEEELGIKNVARIYDEGAKDEIDPNTEMIAITRSSYFIRMNEIHERLKTRKENSDEPWIIIFDEAQHLGKEGGQFTSITSGLETIMDGRHRELDLTATLWHPDKALITDYLEGNVYGMFLTIEEQAELQAGQKLPELCRLQFYRAMQQGYLSPIYGLNLIRQVGDSPTADLLNASLSDLRAGTRTVRRYKDLLKDVGKRVRHKQISGLPDRGVFYVDSQARADAYAKELSKELGLEVRSFHSGPGVDPTTYDWFSDRKDFATTKDKQTPKYIVSVDILKEGVDIPCINLIVLLRKYGDDMGGFRNLIQNIGRGSRNFSDAHQLKPHLRILDYSLYTRWLRDGLAEISVEPRLAAPGSRNRAPGYLVVDEEVFDPITFQNEYFSLFPKDGSFVQEFPFFDLAVFQAQGLRSLHELSGSYGIVRFNYDFGAKRLILKLAHFLPASPEKDRLISQLNDDAYWGWKSSDGSDAKGSVSGEEPAFQRIYRALYRIAALRKISANGRELNLSKIHETSEFEKLLDLLDTDRVKSLILNEQRQVFVDKEKGTWAALVQETLERNLGKVSDIDGTGRLIEALAQDLPPSADKEALLLRLKGDLAIGDTDGQTLNSKNYADEQAKDRDDRVRVRGSLQRVYRAFYAIAQALKKTPAGADIDVSKLYEKAEAEKVLKLLRPTRHGVIFDLNKKTIFWDQERGSLRFLAAKNQNLGIGAFSRSFGSVNLLLELSKKLPESQERDELIKDFEDRTSGKWGPKDGSLILTEGYDNPTREFFLGLCRIAEAHNRLSPSLSVDLNKIHEKAEGERFYDYLILGFAIPAPTAEELRQFAYSSAPLLRSQAREQGVSAYVTNFGPKRLTLTLAQRLEEKYKGAIPEKVITALKNDALWGWHKGDGDMIGNGTSPAALLSLYRGTEAIRFFLEKVECSVQPDNSPKPVHTADGIFRLLAI